MCMVGLVLVVGKKGGTAGRGYMNMVELFCKLAQVCGGKYKGAVAGLVGGSLPVVLPMIPGGGSGGVEEYCRVVCTGAFLWWVWSMAVERVAHYWALQCVKRELARLGQDEKDLLVRWVRRGAASCFEDPLRKEVALLADAGVIFCASKECHFVNGERRVLFSLTPQALGLLYKKELAAVFVAPGKAVQRHKGAGVEPEDADGEE